MSITPGRIDTIKAIIMKNAISSHADFSKIMNEFDEVKRARWVVRIVRRHLLQIIHASRGLDTTLKAFVQYHSLSPNAHNLGNNLKTIRDHSKAGVGKISEDQRRHFYRNIVKVRNHYMHEAGAFPSGEKEVRDLISEMEYCVATVVGL